MLDLKGLGFFYLKVKQASMNNSNTGAFFDFDQTLLDTESSRLGFKYLWERRLISVGFLARVMLANFFYKRRWMWMKR